MFDSPELFEDVALPENLAMSIFTETAEFNHRVPSALQAQFTLYEKMNFENKSGTNPVVEKSLDSETSCFRSIEKFVTPFELYEFVLGNVKRAMDFELLKLYDFLLENPGSVIKSNKLLEIKPYLEIVCEREYCKRSPNVEIIPHVAGTEKPSRDFFIDQWASNLRRNIEIKNELANDYVDLAAKHSRAIPSPEIRMLLFHLSIDNL